MKVLNNKAKEEMERKEKPNKAKAFHNETQWEKETGKLEWGKRNNYAHKEVCMCVWCWCDVVVSTASTRNMMTLMTVSSLGLYNGAYALN